MTKPLKPPVLGSMSIGKKANRSGLKGDGLQQREFRFGFPELARVCYAKPCASHQQNGSALAKSPSTADAYIVVDVSLRNEALDSLFTTCAEHADCALNQSRRRQGRMNYSLLENHREPRDTIPKSDPRGPDSPPWALLGSLPGSASAPSGIGWISPPYSNSYHERLL